MVWFFSLHSLSSTHPTGLRVVAVVWLHHWVHSSQVTARFIIWCVSDTIEHKIHSSHLAPFSYIMWIFWYRRRGNVLWATFRYDRFHFLCVLSIPTPRSLLTKLNHTQLHRLSFLSHDFLKSGIRFAGHTKDRLWRRNGRRCLFRLYWVRSASLVVLLLAGGLGWLWLCWCVWSQSQDYPNGDPPSLFSSRSAGSTAGLSAAALIKQQQMDQASSAGSDGHQVHKTWGKVHHKVHKVLCGLPIPQYKQTFRHSSCEFNGLFWVLSL